MASPCREATKQSRLRWLCRTEESRHWVPANEAYVGFASLANEATHGKANRVSLRHGCCSPGYVGEAKRSLLCSCLVRLLFASPSREATKAKPACSANDMAGSALPRSAMPYVMAKPRSVIANDGGDVVDKGEHVDYVVPL